MPETSFVPKYQQIASIIRQRILYGDYSLKDLPSERRLAQEMGVNYMTVRRGLQLLEVDHLLVRQGNGRLRVRRFQQEGKKHLNLAFVSPTFESGNAEAWRQAIEKAAANLSCNVKPVLYMRWDDPILRDALAGFDGIFVYPRLEPRLEPLPASLAAEMRKPRHPVVVVDGDFSHYGLPSILMFPPASVQVLLDHLALLGHTRIGCLNTQPSGWEMQQRISQWRGWMAARQQTGRLIDSPVQSHGDPVQHAFEVMNEILRAPQPPETAWLCTTTPAAVGAMRSMLDHGIMPGRGMAVCAVNGENLSEMLNPRLTVVAAPDVQPYLMLCLRWMLEGGPWQGPSLMCPPDLPLLVRESTQPVAGGPPVSLA